MPMTYACCYGGPKACFKHVCMYIHKEKQSQPPAYTHVGHMHVCVYTSNYKYAFVEVLLCFVIMRLAIEK